eukprot:1171343-Alexandrium_andersonii.AAC.1
MAMRWHALAPSCTRGTRWGRRRSTRAARRRASGGSAMATSRRHRIADSSGRLNLAAHGPSVLVELEEVAVDGQELHVGRSDGLELAMLNLLLEADAII